MMLSRQDHKTQFEAAYSGKAKYARDTSEQAIEICFRTYRNAYRNGLGSMLMGRIERGGLIGIGDLERANFGTTDYVRSGGVLSSGYWSIPLNDSWLIGGIHAGHPFDVASPLTRENIEDKTSGFRITVTGRELIGLEAFGYTYSNVWPEHSNGYFSVSYRGQAAQASFSAYESAVDAAVSNGSWQALIKA